MGMHSIKTGWTLFYFYGRDDYFIKGLIVTVAGSMDPDPDLILALFQSLLDFQFPGFRVQLEILFIF